MDDDECAYKYLTSNVSSQNDFYIFGNSKNITYLSNKKKWIIPLSGQLTNQDSCLMWSEIVLSWITKKKKNAKMLCKRKWLEYIFQWKLLKPCYVWTTDKGRKEGREREREWVIGRLKWRYLEFEIPKVALKHAWFSVVVKTFDCLWPTNVWTKFDATVTITLHYTCFDSAGKARDFNLPRFSWFEFDSFGLTIYSNGDSFTVCDFSLHDKLWTWFIAESQSIHVQRQSYWEFDRTAATSKVEYTFVEQF